MSFFDAYGPFEIPREGGAVTGRQAAFWNETEERTWVATAIGCYVFGMRNGAKIRPWYVGKTVAQAGFRGEVFPRHKIGIYNDCLARQRGIPVLFLFPLITSTDGDYRFSKAAKSKSREIKLLETQLMGFAHRKNPNISNVHEMAFLRGLEVRGLIGARRGRPYREAQAVRAMLIG